VCLPSLEEATFSSNNLQSATLQRDVIGQCSGEHERDEKGQMMDGTTGKEKEL
jgi:hypothetical protein